MHACSLLQFVMHDSRLASLTGYSTNVRFKLFAMKSPSASRNFVPPSCSLCIEKKRYTYDGKKKAFEDEALRVDICIARDDSSIRTAVDRDNKQDKTFHNYGWGFRTYHVTWGRHSIFGYAHLIMPKNDPCGAELLLKQSVDYRWLQHITQKHKT